MCRTRSVTGALCNLVMLCVLVSASGCAWLDTRQRQLIYRPSPATASDSASLRTGDERFFLKVPEAGAEQSIALWWMPHSDQNAPTLLYLHGTFRNLQQNLHKIKALREAGFSVLAVDYRGWGESTAIVPSERSILQDTHIAWAEMTRREPRPAQRVIYGHSMGTGVAVDLASQMPSQADYGALILESAFTSFPDVAAHAGLLARLVSAFSNERFASINKIAKVQVPVLMIHGTQDSTVPMKLGLQLFEAANAPKQWLAIEGGQHSDLNLTAPTQYQATLAAFKSRYLPKP